MKRFTDSLVLGGTFGLVMAAKKGVLDPDVASLHSLLTRCGAIHLDDAFRLACDLPRVERAHTHRYLNRRHLAAGCGGSSWLVLACD